MVAGASGPSVFTYEQFQNLVGPQLHGNQVPRSLWPTVYQKLMGQIFDAGNSFQIALMEEGGSDEAEAVEEVEEAEKEDTSEAVNEATEDTRDEAGDEEVSETTGPTTRVLMTLSEIQPFTNVWLIDHAWTFRLREARKKLEESPELLARVADLVDVKLSGDEENVGLDVDSVYNKIWYKAGHYRIASETQLDEEACWFMMDEVGSAIQITNDTQAVNCLCAPVFFPPTQCAFNLLWATKAIEESGMIYVGPSPKAHPTINAILYGDNDSYDTESLSSALKMLEDTVAEAHKSMPNGVISNDVPPYAQVIGDPAIKIFTDVVEVAEFAQRNGPKWAVADSLIDANFIWLAESHPELIPNLPPSCTFYNQFGSEIHYCHKGNLAHLIRRNRGFVSWMPRTYDAQTELHLFAADYLRRQHAIDVEGKIEENNLWIVKPTSMARSMDMVVTSSLPLLLRNAETGPKIISKYIHNPLTYKKRKFDLRLVAVSRGLAKPNCEVFLYDKIFPRFALEDYSLDNFDCYEKHWTVMNYANGERMIKMMSEDFIKKIDEEYGPGTWDKCYVNLKNMITEAFEAIVTDEIVKAKTEESLARVPKGSNAAFGTIIGIDAMLTDTFEAKLIEIGFSIDCEGANKRYPDFYQNVFDTLLTGKGKDFVRL